MKHRRNGNGPQAEQALANPLLVARKKLEDAENARKARRFDQAQRICETILKQFPDYVGALHTLGLIHADKGEYRRALPYLVQASMLHPEDCSTLTVLSGVYLQLGSGVTALRTLEQARAIKPDDPKILATLGEVNREEREYAAGAEMYRKTLAVDPKLHAARFGLGICCYELGDMPGASKAFESLVAQGVNSSKLIYSLSQLPPAFIKSDILALADSASEDGETDRVDFGSMLSFSRAAAYHHLGRFEEAWNEAVSANVPIRERMRKTYVKHRQLEKTFLEGVQRFKWPAPDNRKLDASKQASLFILGPSRSGKTKLERQLGTHKDIKQGHESPIVENAVRQAFQSAALPTRDRIFELPPALDQSFRDFYNVALARRSGEAHVFTNTHPAHMFSALRLAHILPDARFVFVKRNLDDITFRIFMKRYRSGNAYAYGLEEIRDHLQWYYTMIDLVSAHLPDRSLLIEYEQMIDDPENVFNAVVEHSGLSPVEFKQTSLGDDRGCAEPYLTLMNSDKSYKGH